MAEILHIKSEIIQPLLTQFGINPDNADFQPIADIIGTLAQRLAKLCYAVAIDIKSEKPDFIDVSAIKGKNILDIGNNPIDGSWFVRLGTYLGASMTGMHDTPPQTTGVGGSIDSKWTFIPLSMSVLSEAIRSDNNISQYFPAGVFDVVHCRGPKLLASKKTKTVESASAFLYARVDNAIDGAGLSATKEGGIYARGGKMYKRGARIVLPEESKYEFYEVLSSEPL